MIVVAVVVIAAVHGGAHVHGSALGSKGIVRALDDRMRVDAASQALEARVGARGNEHADDAEVAAHARLVHRGRPKLGKRVRVRVHREHLLHLLGEPRCRRGHD